MFLENLKQSGFFQTQNSVLTIGYKQVILNLFLEIIDLVQVEKTGYQAIDAGMQHQLLAELYTINHRIRHFDSKKERRIQKTNVIFLNYFELPWPFEILQGSLGETNVKLNITLSYFIEPNPGSRKYSNKFSYQSYGLGFNVIGELIIILD